MEYTHSPESHKFHGASVPGYTGYIPGLRQENTIGERFATARAQAINASLGVTPVGSPISPGFKKVGSPIPICSSKKQSANLPTSAHSSCGSKRSSEFALANPSSENSSKQTSDLQVRAVCGSKTSLQSSRISVEMQRTKTSSASSAPGSKNGSSQLHPGQSKKTSTTASAINKHDSPQSKRSSASKTAPDTPLQQGLASPMNDQLRQGIWQPTSGFPESTRLRPGGEIPGYRGHFGGRSENIVGQSFKRANEAKLKAVGTTSRTPCQVTETEGHMFGSHRSSPNQGRY